MLYYLFSYLHEQFDMPGAGVFQYISFRAGMAFLFSLVIMWVGGKWMIAKLRRKQIGETVRELGLDGQKEKEGTPTMGGLIIIAAILIPVLLLCRLDNIYVLLMLLTTVWLGAMGFMDDYIKVFKHDKHGLQGKFKVVGQVVLGLVVGLVMCFHPDVVVSGKNASAYVENHNMLDQSEYEQAKAAFETSTEKSLVTTIPFVKNNELDYRGIVEWVNPNWGKYAWILFVLVVIFVITAVSNGSNLTDGIDGLATGTSAIIGATLAILSWVSGNIIFADYLNIMYIPHVGELTIFISAFVGATIGFLWYNTYPAQVFMGDTGSLTIGGIIAVFALLIRKELLLPILCGIFLVESLSVIMQVSYFKYTKKRCGEGRRIFKMTPIHHHYQVAGFKEPKIVMRFFIIGLLLAVVTLVTLKLR
ncbi:MAG: phospho-N-acetylmuramoyl-pentapeptide-transferase [Bacteroides sp.]|nr:phospho-N-acetylmuramoyl-pentapeptide-transferase [Bacteroides sp.]MCM1086320.1 phospho-N-acetylmuramoyl-pentapeptide-transferase [Bacteroides sp.]MCM1170040.1 phospho-N-acetylmuramoyl-pentapeptide-transferase [Bacteroides sp.]